MVAVWRCGHLKLTCTCEFVPLIGSIDIFHISDRVNSFHRSCPRNAVWTRSMRTGFALNLHWPIRLLNQFESRFSVDRP